MPPRRIAAAPRLTTPGMTAPDGPSRAGAPLPVDEASLAEALLVLERADPTTRAAIRILLAHVLAELGVTSPLLSRAMSNRLLSVFARLGFRVPFRTSHTPPRPMTTERLAVATLLPSPPSARRPPGAARPDRVPPPGPASVPYGDESTDSDGAQP